MDEERKQKSDLLRKWIELANEHQKIHGEVPVVIGVELYEYFHGPVKIVDANVYRGGVEVTVESRSGKTATIESDELDLRSV